MTQATESTESVTADEAAAIVDTMHRETLGIERSAITSQRADKLVSSAKAHTTTELLLLLARFHADVDDAAGSALLADFALKFAELEATVV